MILTKKFNLLLRSITRSVTSPLFTRSDSGPGIDIRLKIQLLIRMQVQNHNTSINVMFPLFTGSESGSGLIKKLKIRLLTWIKGRNRNTSINYYFPKARPLLRSLHYVRI